MKLKVAAGKKKQRPCARQGCVLPERLTHSHVARILGQPDKESRLSKVRESKPRQQKIWGDEVSEQLSPLENLALDADTKVTSLFSPIAMFCAEAAEHVCKV